MLILFHVLLFPTLFPLDVRGEGSYNVAFLTVYVVSIGSVWYMLAERMYPRNLKCSKLFVLH
jgi:hypothetical protein